MTEAERNQGTPKERELMKEDEDGKGVTDLARSNATQTTQTAMLSIGGGTALVVVSLVALKLGRKRSHQAQT